MAYFTSILLANGIYWAYNPFIPNIAPNKPFPGHPKYSQWCSRWFWGDFPRPDLQPSLVKKLAYASKKDVHSWVCWLGRLEEKGSTNTSYIDHFLGDEFNMVWIRTKQKLSWYLRNPSWNHMTKKLWQKIGFLHHGWIFTLRLISENRWLFCRGAGGLEIWGIESFTL